MPGDERRGVGGTHQKNVGGGGGPGGANKPSHNQTFQPVKIVSLIYAALLRLLHFINVAHRQDLLNLTLMQINSMSLLWHAWVRFVDNY